MRPVPSRVRTESCLSFLNVEKFVIGFPLKWSSLRFGRLPRAATDMMPFPSALMFLRVVSPMRGLMSEILLYEMLRVSSVGISMSGVRS